MGLIVNFWPAVNLALGRNTLAKSTALIISASHALAFLAPVYFGWALDLTGNTDLGMYTAIVVILMNLTCLISPSSGAKAGRRRPRPPSELNGGSFLFQEKSALLHYVGGISR